jgi:hypothetical protein
MGFFIQVLAGGTVLYNHFSSLSPVTDIAAETTTIAVIFPTQNRSPLL